MNLVYAVFGAGAIGGFYGGKLANAGNDVHFLFHSDYDYVAENGLRVDSVGGDFHLQNVNAYNDPRKMPQADVILIGLKTTNNHLITDLVKPLLKENTVVVLIQNGLGIEEKLSLEIPDLQIAGGLAFICSTKAGAGHIKHMDYGKLVLGSYNADDERLAQISADLQGAGIQSEIAPDLNTARWQKLVWNIPFNGMTVVLNATTAQLMTDKNSHQLIYDMMQEVIAAAKACGATIDKEFADKMIELTLQMEPYAPSMKVDFENKRPLEIDAIYSQPVSHAQKNGSQMQKVEVLEKQLLFLNARNVD